MSLSINVWQCSNYYLTIQYVYNMTATERVEFSDGAAPFVGRWTYMHYAIEFLCPAFSQQDAL